MTTKQQHQSGIVERVEFTHGGAGNQWTTISGVRYATFWDIKTKDWAEGDEVEFDVVSAPLWTGQAPLLRARNIRKAQPKVIYLTNACGETTGYGTLELTEADFAKVPFERGPGYVRLYIAQIGEAKYLMANIEVDYKDDVWGEDGKDYPEKPQVQAYCEAACEFIRPRLTDGAMLLPIEDLDEGYLVIRVAVPLDSQKDRAETMVSVSRVFGVVADLADLPFVDVQPTAEVSAEPQAAAAARATETVDITPSWGEWGALYRRFAESGETKVLKELRSDFAKAMASAEALKAIQKTLSDEQQKIVAEVLAREIGKQGY